MFFFFGVLVIIFQTKEYQKHKKKKKMPEGCAACIEDLLTDCSVAEVGEIKLSLEIGKDRMKMPAMVKRKGWYYSTANIPVCDRMEKRIGKTCKIYVHTPHGTKMLAFSQEMMRNVVKSGCSKGDHREYYYPARETFCWYFLHECNDSWVVRFGVHETALRSVGALWTETQASEARRVELQKLRKGEQKRRARARKHEAAASQRQAEQDLERLHVTKVQNAIELARIYVDANQDDFRPQRTYGGTVLKHMRKSFIDLYADSFQDFETEQEFLRSLIF